MGSQQPKFQYAPNLLDVWKQLQSVNDDLANEVDNPLPQELQQVVNLLYQRDRQLEDYLTNLPTGGGGAPVPYELDSFGVPDVTYLGFVSEIWGAVDVWRLVFPATGSVGSVTAGKYGTVLGTVAGDLIIGSATGPFRVDILDTDFSIATSLGSVFSTTPGALPVPIISGSASYNVPIALMDPSPASRMAYLSINQPAGSSSISSSLTLSSFALEQSQTQLFG